MVESKPYHPLESNESNIPTDRNKGKSSNTKKDVYESDMQKIWNLIVGQINEQLQEKVSSDATLPAVKTEQDPIGYLMILKRLCF